MNNLLKPTRAFSRSFEDALKLTKRFMGKIIVEPEVSLVTEPVSIWGHSFEPYTPVTLQATVHSSSQKLSFKSLAHYTTSAEGSFHLMDTEALSGSYSGIDGMGLFWSMTPCNDSYSRIQTVNAKEALEYKFNIYNGHHLEPNASDLLSSASINRYFAGEGITRVAVKKGDVQGTMFIPGGTGPFPGIITLFGGNKSRQVVEDIAAILSNHGYTTLALAYFGVEGLPNNYTDDPIKIERFQQAVYFLQSREHVNADAIGVIGSSKGGDIALAMASHLPQIRSVVGLNACISSAGADTTYKNHVTKTLGFDLSRIKFLPENTINILESLNDPLDEPESIHPVERTSADILLIASSNDQIWKSVHFASIAKERMTAAGKDNCEIIEYEGLGHVIDAPYTPPCVKLSHLLVPKEFLVSYGGENIRAHTYDQIDLWDKVINFFSKTLTKKSKL